MQIDFLVVNRFEFNKKLVTLGEGGELQLSKFLTNDEFSKVYKDLGVIAVKEKLASQDYIGAAKLMVTCKCTSNFDPFETISAIIGEPQNNGLVKQLIDGTTGDS